MWNPLPRHRCGPIGVDLGAHFVKLVQFDAERQRLVDAARWEMPAGDLREEKDRVAHWSEALRRAREGRTFRGRDAVVCLGAHQLHVQNVRVPKNAGADLDHIVREELAPRAPFDLADAELRIIDAGEVRQADAVKREILVLACLRPVIDEALSVVEAAGLRPIAVDPEPLALLRGYARQFRREEDKNQRFMVVHLGATNTAVVIAQGAHVLFMKYIDVGGKDFDEAVARDLRMDVAAAAVVRKHHGDRRADQQDPDVAAGVARAVRPVVERLISELSMCLRYHGVTFRNQSLRSLVLGGGEATPQLAEMLSRRLDVKCELGDPLRSFDPPSALGRRAQWDVAAGLALRQSLPA